MPPGVMCFLELEVLCIRELAVPGGWRRLEIDSLERRRGTHSICVRDRRGSLGARGMIWGKAEVFECR